MNKEEFIQLRNVLTKGSSNFLEDRIIDVHPDIEKEVIDEIYHTIKILDKFLKEFTNLDTDYIIHSLKRCHTLSSLFVLYDSSWTLEQGIFKNCDTFYHSWVKKGEVIYDPSFRFITLSSLYSFFFHLKYQYSQEELKKLFRRTCTFTYYEEDLKYNLLNTNGNYDCIETLKNADSFLQNFQQKIKSKTNIY